MATVEVRDNETVAMYDRLVEFIGKTVKVDYYFNRDTMKIYLNCLALSSSFLVGVQQVIGDRYKYGIIINSDNPFNVLVGSFSKVNKFITPQSHRFMIQVYYDYDSLEVPKGTTIH